MPHRRVRSGLVAASSDHPPVFLQNGLFKLADSAGLLQEQNMGADIGEEVEEQVSTGRILFMLSACSCPINQVMEALRSRALP